MKNWSNAVHSGLYWPILRALIHTSFPQRLLGNFQSIVFWNCRLVKSQKMVKGLYEYWVVREMKQQIKFIISWSLWGFRSVAQRHYTCQSLIFLSTKKANFLVKPFWVLDITLFCFSASKINVFSGKVFSLGV